MGAITDAEKRELAEAINRFNSKADALLGGNSSNSTITVQGATGWQVTACLLIAVLGLASGAFGLYIAADTRNEQRSDALKMGQEAAELRQDIKAIRAYINAGMVRPKEK